jgi:hypothetical protein
VLLRGAAAAVLIVLILAVTGLVALFHSGRPPAR